MHLYNLRCDVISQTSLKITTKVSYLLCYFNKTRASGLCLGFQYFELRNIYEQILNRILRIPIFSSELIHR